MRGVFERHQNLKFVGCHLGGGICDVIGRMDYAYELGDKASGLGPYEPMLITKKPSEYLKKLYHGYGRLSSAGVMCAYQTVGAKQLLFGSDAPPLLPLLPRAKQIIEELPITEAEREDIFGWNALKLLQRQVTRQIPPGNLTAKREPGVASRPTLTPQSFASVVTAESAMTARPGIILTTRRAAKYLGLALGICTGLFPTHTCNYSEASYS